MDSLNASQARAVESSLDGMRRAYNAFKVDACDFSGVPDDLSSLDYIPYELPIAAEYEAGSVAFSLCWGHVLTKSFGFEWGAADGLADARGFALRRDDPAVLLFPYYRLKEVMESSGTSDSPAQTLWFDTIRYFEHRSYTPDGWHPVFDAVRCPEKIGCPPSVTKECERLIDAMPDFYYTMSTYTYEWVRDGQWDQLRDYAGRLATQARLLDGRR